MRWRCSRKSVLEVEHVLNRADTVIGPPLYHSSQVGTRRVVREAEGIGDVTADRPLSLEESEVASHRTGQMGVPGSIYGVCDGPWV